MKSKEQTRNYRKGKGIPGRGRELCKHYVLKNMFKELLVVLDG